MSAQAKLEREERWERWEREEAERKAWEAEQRAWEVEHRELVRREADARFQDFLEMKKWREREQADLAAHRQALEATWVRSAEAYERIAIALERMSRGAK